MKIRTPMNAIIGMATIAAANIHDQNRVEDCLARIGFSSQTFIIIDQRCARYVKDRRRKADHES